VATFTAIVLAGTRGEGDALARSQKVRHRALLEVAGVPMLLRVLRALRQCPQVGDLVVSIDDPAAAEAEPEIEAWVETGELRLHRSLASPSRSVLDLLDTLGNDAPVLVTTADHALLSQAVLEHFLGACSGSEADLKVGLVARSVLEARFPGQPRTYLPFRDEAYSGANLFAFLTPRARNAALFWVQAEAFRKRPLRLVRAFGFGTLALFVLRRLDLGQALERASRTIGAHVEAVVIPIAEAAVDVDRPEDLELVNRILAESQPNE